jgi:L-ribulose-5-phosphate 3-epimerase
MIIEKKYLSLMQGRLVKPLKKPIQEFPLKDWKKELDLLLKLNLKNIEWVVDRASYEQNPLVFDNQALETLMKNKNLSISAVSNDYFLDTANSYENITFSDLLTSIEMQQELISNIGEFKKYILVMPFIENSSLKKYSKKQVEKLLEVLLSFESNYKLDYALELDIDRNEITHKLGKFLGNRIFINLDVGNTVSFGFDIKSEINDLSQFILNVHLKDRIMNGPTVPLETGSTDIKEIIKLLIHAGYRGAYTLQFARKYEDDYKTIEEYLEIISKYE